VRMTTTQTSLTSTTTSITRPTPSQNRNTTTTIFFFQAEDGIRDLTVTGVQTCALPILDPLCNAEQHDVIQHRPEDDVVNEGVHQIGRASCREGVLVLVVAELLLRNFVDAYGWSGTGSIGYVGLDGLFAW